MTTPNDALDFYPTPDSLAFDMVFSLREVKSGFTTYPKPILEPSAGDGALARQVHALAFNVHHDYKTGEVDRYDKEKARSAELDCIVNLRCSSTFTTSPLWTLGRTVPM